jgi:hypothetical protein
VPNLFLKRGLIPRLHYKMTSCQHASALIGRCALASQSFQPSATAISITT